MKKSMTTSLSLAAGVLVLGTVLFSACSKDNDATPATVSEEEAAEAVGQAVAGTSGGLAVELTTAADMATIYSTDCGLSKDTTIARSNAAGAVVTYHASAQWHWTLNCSPGARFDYSFSGAVSYDAPRMASNDSLSSTLSLTGLDASATQYVLSVNTVRKGSQESKIRNKTSFTSTITFSATDITVSKSTGLIQSGTASVSVSGTASTGSSFQYAGTLVFTGSQTATLTLGSGATYNIQW